MATQYKTRCPHCSAQFRISEDHLKQANGAVRCGSCLKVFQASENLVKEAPAARPAAKAKAKAKAPAKKVAQRKAPAQKAAPKAAPKAKAPAQKAASPENWSLPADKKEEQAKPKWTMDDSVPDDSSDPLDQDFDDKSVTRAEYKGNDTSVSLGKSELSDSFMNLDEDDGESLSSESFSDMAGAAKSEQGGNDESWAEKLLEELDDQPDTPAPKSKDEAAKEEDWSAEADDFFGGDVESSPPAAAREEEQDVWSEEAGDFFGDANLDQSSGTGTDQVGAIELPQVESRPIRRASLPRPDMSNVDVGEMVKWAALSVAATVVLFVQYMIFNFDELARTPEWRPFYSGICNTAGCQLPNPSNVEQLRGSNLVIRDHPSVADALVVDVIVFNDAQYEQPFPLLELGFYSLDGRPIASRVFNPDEYRQGELSDMASMPRNTPVHISFDIMDPGEEAVNYTLRFRPAADLNQS